METGKSGVWTLPNGEKITVTLKVLPDGRGRFGGVYVTATAAFASGSPSSAPVAVTVEDEEGNAYTYTPVVPNMGLFAKLPDRFFAADYPVGNGPLPSRLVWRVTGASLYSDDWEEATGEPFELAYYPAGRVGASGECLTEYPWRWWWGEDCEAPLPISRELIPTEGNPLPVKSCDPDYIPRYVPIVEDPLAVPFLIPFTLRGQFRPVWGFASLDAQGVTEYLSAAYETKSHTGEYTYVELGGWEINDGNRVQELSVNIALQREFEPILGTFDFCLGLFSDMSFETCSVVRIKDNKHLIYDKIELLNDNAEAEYYPSGFTTAGCGSPFAGLSWFRFRVSGLRENPDCAFSSCEDFAFSLEWDNVDGVVNYSVYPVVLLGNSEPPLNPYTGNYAPFVIGGGACRDDILNSPKHRGRLTHMRLPDCDIDYYVKWWDNSGACYVLPYSIIGGKTEGRQDGTPLYQDTQTLRLASPLLTEAERKDAMTIAESPRVAIRPYGGEWRFARLKDFSVSWEAGEADEAALEIEVIANYGED